MSVIASQAKQSLFFILIILISLVFQFKITRSQTIVNDFCQDYVALQNFKFHQPIYRFFPVKNCWQNLKILTYQYPAHPPSTLLFFIPFSYLSLSQATLIWDITNIILYFLILLILLTYLGKLTLKTLTFIFLLSSIWLGLLISLSSRNLILLLTLLISLSLLIYNKKPNISGFLIGIASLIKLWPIFLLFSPRISKYSLTGFLTIAVGALGSLVIFGWQNNLDYLQKVVPFEHIFIKSVNNISLTSALAKSNYSIFFSSTYAFILVYISLLLFKKYKGLNYEIFSAVVLLAIFVFMPLTWDNSAPLLLIPLFILVKNIKHYHHSDIGFFALGFIPLLGPDLSERANNIMFSFIFSSLPLFALVSFLRYNKHDESSS